MSIPLRVLFLEDQPDDVHLLERELRRAGFEVAGKQVETEADFLSYLTPDLDVILSDYNLPAWNGLEALRVVWRRQREVPFILVSGTIGEELAVQMMREGCADYLLKDRLARLGPAIRQAMERRQLTEVRRRSEQDLLRLAALVRSSEDAIIAKDLSGAITSWNPAAEQLFGWSAAEAIGQPISLIVPPERRNELESIRERLQRGIRVEQQETECLRKDGSRAPVTLKVSPIRDGTGQMIGASAIVRNITERKRWEEERLARERLFRGLIENSWDGVSLIDPQGVTLYASPSTQRILGYTPEEFQGQRGLDLVHPEDIPGTLQCLLGLQGNPGGVAASTYRMRRKDGSWRWIETTATNLLEDPHVRAVVLNSRDVTETRAAMEALRESEERYRELANSLPGGVYTCAADGACDFCNQWWLDYCGLAPEEILGEGWLNSLHPEDHERTRLGWLQARTAGIPFHGEYRLRRADGAYRWFVDRAMPLRDPSGRVARWVGTCMDIEDRRRAEGELRRTADLLKAVAQGTTDAVFVKDSAGRYLFVNPATAQFIGRAEPEVLGKTDADLFDEASTRLVMASDRKVMETGKAWTFEETLTAAGRVRTFLATKAPYWDETGSIIGIIGIARDITARRQAEEALLLRDRAIQAVTQGIVICDPKQPDQPIIYASPGFQRLTGYQAEEVIGRNCRFLQGKDTDPAALVSIRQAMREGKPCSVELLNYRKDGTSFWNELSISPIFDAAGQVTHFVGVQADVTQRRLLEEQFRQSQKMEAVGQLAGGVAHDFNNLLTIITGYSDLLLQTLTPDEPTRELVLEIRKAGERSAALTRQLLAFSRKQVLSPRVLDLNEVVRDMGKMLLRVLGEDVELIMDLQEKLGSVKADPGQMEQVLLNLAVNARDAMPQGGRLRIETRDTDLDKPIPRAYPPLPTGSYVVLTIQDTGTGIPPEVQGRLFEPFFTTKGPGKGTGLGLAVVHGIIAQSGGHIVVQSTPGQGSRFHLYLPRLEQVARSSKSAPGLTIAPQGKETILLVEDDGGVRALTRHVLLGCGYHVLESGTGEEALRLASTHTGPLHLLLTDVVMPGLGGRQLAERLVTFRPDLKVLYLSGYTNDAVVRHGILHEQVNFLQKPFTPLGLAQKVREVLGPA